MEIKNFIIILWLLFFYSINFIYPGEKDDFISKKYNAEIIKCDDWVKLKLNNFYLLNNVWGKGNIKKYTQCLYKVSEKELFPVGWSWKWPVGNKDTVKGYPDISFGWMPWSDKSTTPLLPVKIGNINEITVFYDIQSKIKGKYNLSFDLWITKEPGRTEPPDTNVVREIMIWIDHKGIDYPQNWFIRDVSIDNERYKLYIAKKLKTEKYIRDFIVFMKDKPEYKGDTKISEFIKYLLKNNYILSSEYLENIDLGNEINYGEGETVINNYKIIIK